MLLKLASVTKKSCFSEIGCLSGSSQASQSALLTESKVCFSSDVILIVTSVFKSL